jgi:hypothetical protein
LQHWHTECYHTPAVQVLPILAAIALIFHFVRGACRLKLVTHENVSPASQLGDAGLQASRRVWEPRKNVALQMFKELLSL